MQEYKQAKQNKKKINCKTTETVSDTYMNEKKLALYWVYLKKNIYKLYKS